jgi:hypothetical protein
LWGIVLPKIRTGTIHDIGYHGVLVEIDRELPLYSEIKLQFDLPLVDYRAGNIYAKIVAQRSRGGPIRLGLEFTSVPAETNMKIRLFVQLLISSRSLRTARQVRGLVLEPQSRSAQREGRQCSGDYGQRRHRSAWRVREPREAGLGAADPLVCSKCKGPMRVIALIEDPAVVRAILTHLGLWQPQALERAPPAPARAWPQHANLPLIHPLPDIA